MVILLLPLYFSMSIILGQLLQKTLRQPKGLRIKTTTRLVDQSYHRYLKKLSSYLREFDNKELQVLALPPRRV